MESNLLTMRRALNPSLLLSGQKLAQLNSWVQGHHLPNGLYCMNVLVACYFGTEFNTVGASELCMEISYCIGFLEIWVQL